MISNDGRIVCAVVCAAPEAIPSASTDRVLFSIDYPFESMEEGSAWFDGAEIGENDCEKIGRCNAAKLFGLGRGRQACQGGRARPSPRSRALESSDETPPVYRRGCFVMACRREASGGLRERVEDQEDPMIVESD